MVYQKYVSIRTGELLGPSGSDTYLASQCKGHSGIEKDLANGWIVKWCWQDRYYIVFILEKND